MIHKFTTTVLLLLSSVFLFGCSSYHKAINGLSIKQNINNVNSSQLQLAEAATSISNAMIELAAIQKAVYPAVKLPDMPDAEKIGMGRLSSLDWTGPIEPLVRNIAKVTNYRLRIIGKKPAIPILIAINSKNIPIAVILRNAAYQCLNKADIVVYPNSKVIELRYAKI